MLLPLMSDDAAQADDQAPIELTDLLPAENAGEDAGLRLSLQDESPASTAAASDQAEQAAAPQSGLAATSTAASAPEFTPGVT